MHKNEMGLYYVEWLHLSDHDVRKEYHIAVSKKGKPSHPAFNSSIYLPSYVGNLFSGKWQRWRLKRALRIASSPLSGARSQKSYFQLHSGLKYVTKYTKQAFDLFIIPKSQYLFN